MHVIGMILGALVVFAILRSICQPDETWVPRSNNSWRSSYRMTDKQYEFWTDVDASREMDRD